MVEALKNGDKPFVIWPSPAIEKTGALQQRGFLKDLLDLDAGRKTLLSPAITPEKLKQEVFALLKPGTKISPAAGSKPRVYLIYDSRQNSERDNAGRIAFHYRNEFHFDDSNDPRQHSVGLTQSDGVLLVWGDAGEEWCAAEFEQMVRLSYQPKSRGLCLFDPKDAKTAFAEQIRKDYSAIYVAEQFGPFDPARLEPFFNPLRRNEAGKA
jgi:hypothetical protein